jgi:hypothetical protein
MQNETEPVAHSILVVDHPGAGGMCSLAKFFRNGFPGALSGTFRST